MIPEITLLLGARVVHCSKLSFQPLILSKLNVKKVSALFCPTFRNIYSLSTPLNFHSTPSLLAEPLKKKKRIDPAILRERLERRIKKINREIRRLEKVAKKYKPLAELEVPRKIFKEGNRLRSLPVLSNEEVQRRCDLEKKWSVYKSQQYIDEIRTINRLISAQEKAMDELQEASPELYEQALQPDSFLIPFCMTGPVRTPPIENFDYPEGDYIDVTKKYLPVVPIEQKKKKGRVNSRKLSKMIK